ncbi:MAG: M3 family metallopeptidase, partial [Bacteroidales bacterium]
PSQLMENWGTQKEFLDLFAKHYKTGENLSPELIKKLVDAENFQAGYSSIRQLMFAILDMKWHSLTSPNTLDVPVFETQAIAEAEIFPMAPGMNTSVVFSHIFGGGYAAGYYGYKWAEVLDADAFSVFKKEGIFDAKTASSFRKNILSKGGSAKPMELYIKFRGHEPTMDALLERSGMKQ